jgi:hypothetical protein
MRGSGGRWLLFQHTLHHPGEAPKPAGRFLGGDGMTRGGQAMPLAGIHHLNAISAKPRENLPF